jgi:ABC-type phosphate transport system substrate-binding protein
MKASKPGFNSSSRTASVTVGSITQMNLTLQPTRVTGNLKVIVKDFIDFCTGPDGQKIVAEEGYITID